MVKGFTTLIMISLAFDLGCSGAQFGLGSQFQNFGQRVTYNTQVDVLIVVDSSGSMGSKQTQMAQSFPAFIDYMYSSQFDFNIAVTTMDTSGSGQRGAFVGATKVLSRSTSNLRQSFVNNISVGTAGSDLSSGLNAMKLALSPGMLNGVNAGFLRPSALLAVIFLSDEDDGSVGTTQSYIDYLDSLKPAFPWGYKGWVANSIVVPSLSGTCITNGNFTSAGQRYMALSSASGGVIASICDSDLVAATASIRARIAEMLTQFHLDPPADPKTIKVYMNGAEVANSSTAGWTYDVASANVMFHGPSVPPAGANVQISYTPTTIKN